MAGSREPVPVTVLTGFLGSGKTTLLSALLRRPGMADTAVIVNEFGEIGLDHLLVQKGEENLVLLDSGCLCCAVAGSLGETLGDLHFRAVRGEVPRFARGVVETSGLADPASMLKTLIRDRLVSASYVLDGVVTTIDAVLGWKELDAHPEAVQHVFSAPLRLPSWPSADRRSRLVFVLGEGIGRAALEAALRLLEDPASA